MAHRYRHQLAIEAHAPHHALRDIAEIFDGRFGQVVVQRQQQLGGGWRGAATHKVADSEVC